MGVPLEFTDPGSFQPVNDMMGGGPFNLASGMWTDDTSMALCLAESLITTRDFDPQEFINYLMLSHTGFGES